MTTLTPVITTELYTFAQLCKDCHILCLETINDCMKQGGQYQDATLLSRLRDCAEMCMLCRNMAVDGSEFMGRACLLCADMCERCAIACDAFQNAPNLEACAERCRQAVESFKTMGRSSSTYFRRLSCVNEQMLLCS